MWALTLVVAAITVSSVASQHSNNATRRTSILTPRIVGGLPAQAGDYPYYVTGLGNSLCGGSLIEADIVLTAAHCSDAYTGQVTIGSTKLRGDDAQEVQRVDYTIPHPDYFDNDVTLNDIMLVKLRGRSSQPLAKWNRNYDRPKDGRAVTAMGFGVTTAGEPDLGRVSPDLLEVTMPVVNYDDCLKSFESRGARVFDQIHICAGVEEGGKAPCSGDSGSPLVDASHRLQYGVVSYGALGCALPGLPTVFTRVSAYKDWIEQSVCEHSAYPPDYCDGGSEGIPTAVPTPEPTYEPTSPPLNVPNFFVPTRAPIPPLIIPTRAPLNFPGGTNFPTTVPPSPAPTARRTSRPTTSPSAAPSHQPSFSPSASPSHQSSSSPSASPSQTESAMPTAEMSQAPSVIPSRMFLPPSVSPSQVPSLEPSSRPSVTATRGDVENDTVQPTKSPTTNAGVSSGVGFARSSVSGLSTMIMEILLGYVFAMPAVA